MKQERLVQEILKVYYICCTKNVVILVDDRLLKRGYSVGPILIQLLIFNILGILCRWIPLVVILVPNKLLIVIEI